MDCSGKKGKYCENNICKECVKPGDCPRTQVCQRDGTCGCKYKHLMTMIVKITLSKKFISACQSDNECLNKDLCDKNSGKCFQCKTNKDCMNEEASVCLQGFCNSKYLYYSFNHFLNYY